MCKQENVIWFLCILFGSLSNMVRFIWSGHLAHDYSATWPLMLSSVKKSICCCSFTSKTTGIQMVLDLCIFFCWFRRDDFFTAESNIMDRETWEICWSISTGFVHFGTHCRLHWWELMHFWVNIAKIIDLSGLFGR